MTAPHSSSLAWKILCTEEPSRLQSVGSLGAGQDWRLHFHFSLSHIGVGSGNPLQCSCLENPRGGGAWWAAIYGVSQSRTRLKWLSSSRHARPNYLQKMSAASQCLTPLGKERISALFKGMLSSYSLNKNNTSFHTKGNNNSKVFYRSLWKIIIINGRLKLCLEESLSKLYFRKEQGRMRKLYILNS